MAVSSIVDQIDSSYFRSLSVLSGRERVAVFVEGWGDVSFWSEVLYEYPSVQYDIMPPVRDDLSKGKKVVLDFVEKSGPYLLLAVDSDFDWLFGPKTTSGLQMKNCKWLLQTYAYAIENLQCEPSSLSKVLLKANKVSSDFDFVSFFKSYSKIIYPLFVWHIWSSYSQNNHIFPLKRFSNAITLHNLKNLDSLYKSLSRVSKTVNKILSILSSEYPEYLDEITNMSAFLNAKGVSDDNVIYYIQGHTLMDKAVVPLLQMISSLTQVYQISKIDASNASQSVKQNQIDYFKNSITPIKYCLIENHGYKTTDFYHKIKNDIVSILNSR